MVVKQKKAADTATDRAARLRSALLGGSAFVPPPGPSPFAVRVTVLLEIVAARGFEYDSLYGAREREREFVSFYTGVQHHTERPLRLFLLTVARHRALGAAQHKAKDAPNSAFLDGRCYAVCSAVSHTLSHSSTPIR
jgi:hypothetical protein